MQVKCIKIFDTQGRELTTSSWLTIGKIYVPLEIYCDIKNGISYRLVSDAENKSPGVYKASQFEIIGNNKPSNWVTHINQNGFIEIAPQAWLRGGFWEECYDGNIEALEVYKREARLIMEEEGML